MKIDYFCKHVERESDERGHKKILCTALDIDE